MQRVLQKSHNRYWAVRAYVEGWVLLIVRHGPRGVWKRLTKAPWARSVNFPWSRIALGYGPGDDLKLVLTTAPHLLPSPLVLSARRVRDFVTSVCPTTPPNPRLDAAVALEQEHGVRPLAGDPIRDCVWTSVGHLRLYVGPDGRLSFQAPAIRRTPTEGEPLFDLVDVLWPLYLGVTAISTGAYDRLLGRHSGRGFHYGWELEVSEEVAFPTPLAGPRPIGFPWRTPRDAPHESSRPDPAEGGVGGGRCTRGNCRPDRIVAAVLRDLLAHWGYAPDPVVVAEVLDALRLRRTDPRAVHRQSC